MAIQMDLLFATGESTWGHQNERTYAYRGPRGIDQASQGASNQKLQTDRQTRVYNNDNTEGSRRKRLGRQSKQTPERHEEDERTTTGATKFHGERSTSDRNGPKVSTADRPLARDRPTPVSGPRGARCGL